MNKKAMELSLNTIIIAIIVVIVLIVVVFIFVQRSSIFGKSIDTICTERGGHCAPCDPSKEYEIYSIKGCGTAPAGQPAENARGTCCMPAEQKQ